MRVLSTIVEAAALAMLDIRQQLPLRHAIASQFIRDDHARYILQALEQTLEEPLGGFPVASLLNQDIEDDTILIHGTPQVMLDALDPDETSSRCHLSPGRGRRRSRRSANLSPNFLHHRRTDS
jgi:hypothetical protein